MEEAFYFEKDQNTMPIPARMSDTWPVRRNEAKAHQQILYLCVKHWRVYHNIIFYSFKQDSYVALCVYF